MISCTFHVRTTKPVDGRTDVLKKQHCVLQRKTWHADKISIASGAEAALEQVEAVRPGGIKSTQQHKFGGNGSIFIDLFKNVCRPQTFLYQICPKQNYFKSIKEPYKSNLHNVW